MLSTVLRSKQAIYVNIEIMRAFVRVRQLMEGNRDLAKKLSELEKKYDEQFKAVFDAIRQLISPSLPTNRRKTWTKTLEWLAHRVSQSKRNRNGPTGEIQRPVFHCG